MQITQHWNITREDGSEYTKFFCANGYTVELEKNKIQYTLKGKSGKKINAQNSIDKAVKAIIVYFETL